MKAIIYSCLLLLSSTSLANSSAIFDKLNTSSSPAPQQILQNIENEYRHKGSIVEFELEFDDGRTTYEVTLYSDTEDRFIELLLNANGKTIEMEYESPELDDQEEIAAATLMKSKQLTMQQLVTKLTSNNQEYLIEAQLEQDMGVTYMVATFVTVKGRHKKAIDLATGKNLPLLRWGQ